MEDQKEEKKYTSGWKLLWDIFLLLAGCGVAMFILSKLINKIF